LIRRIQLSAHLRINQIKMVGVKMATIAQYLLFAEITFILEEK
jgi:hypothetical protein